ncbi:UDP-glucose flavonoid 3-O-glucosyltransferase 7 [Rhizoctonia solani]|uniref:UDP-glucose flavonoid 3-O-glucosyltransferase 7 n=1 Tax=Rhizoctonia solani TaxID=456999 RepID=A0A8H8P2V1_9AGAM|nr:UDP-glucose flavonoid 3-O-glucosyltransferase 7 [Rhizoctonia solani]QRW23628.1 UDP-glucose flavonoid 3-O-glucosyltransferase 7 [Rhizoctonia solani]
MTASPLKHIVLIPGPAWGHLRPAMKISLRLVEKFPDLFISLFVCHIDVPKAVKYLESQTSTYSRRVQIVSTSKEEGAPNTER